MPMHLQQRAGDAPVQMRALDRTDGEVRYLANQIVAEVVGGRSLGANDTPLPQFVQTCQKRVFPALAACQ